LHPKIQNTFRYLAAKKIKQIKTTNIQNTLYKRLQHNLSQIRSLLKKNNLTITKADKSKTIVIINKDVLKQKVNTFIQENHITRLNKDPTDNYQKKSNRKFKDVTH
jgi:7-keto-8-aminopelargonate synthetase-like enzyme